MEVGPETIVPAIPEDASLSSLPNVIRSGKRLDDFFKRLPFSHQQILSKRSRTASWECPTMPRARPVNLLLEQIPRADISKNAQEGISAV
jgi:hypothetical protein